MSMFSRSRYLLPTLLLAVTPIALAEVLEWKLDQAHSHVSFKIRHLMVSWVRGSFNLADGTIWFDKDDLSTLRMEIAINPASIDTGMSVRDRDLRGSEFFEVDKYPAMGFVSTKAVPQPDGTVKLTGNLTMHGVTKQVTLDVEGLTTVVQSDNGPRTGASATASLNRSDFGLTYNPILEAGGVTVADEVFIEIDAELKPPERP
jgi:polyisoprenoid-binding protein YceI